jgi:hypothetical protein
MKLSFLQEIVVRFPTYKTFDHPTFYAVCFYYEEDRVEIKIRPSASYSTHYTIEGFWR